jgi:hypothetical protein
VDGYSLHVYDLDSMHMAHDLPINTNPFYHHQLFPFGNGVVLYYYHKKTLECMDMQSKLVRWSVEINDAIIAIKIKEYGVWVQFEKKGLKLYNLATGVVLEEFKNINFRKEAEKLYYRYRFERGDEYILVRHANGTEVDRVKTNELEKLIPYWQPIPKFTQRWESGRCMVVLKAPRILQLYPRSQFSSSYECRDHYYTENKPKTKGKLYVTGMRSRLTVYGDDKKTTVFPHVYDEENVGSTKMNKVPKDHGFDPYDMDEIAQVDVYYVRGDKDKTPELIELSYLPMEEKINQLIHLHTAYPKDIFVTELNGAMRYGLNITF